MLAYGGYACLQLGFIVLIASAFADVGASEAAIIAGAWGLSLTIGWLSFLSPAGLGVRDGLALALFSQAVSVSEAGSIVIASRIVMLAADMAFVGFVELLALGAARRRKQRVSAGHGSIQVVVAGPPLGHEDRISR